MTSRSLLIGSAILLAWVATIGFLVKDQYQAPQGTTDYTSENLFGSVKTLPKWDDIEEYMLIVKTDRQSGTRTIVGATATEIRLLEDPSTSMTYEAKVTLEGKLSPILPAATVKVSSLLDRDVNLTSFHGEAKLGPASFAATGLIEENLLYLKTINNNNPSLMRRDVPQAISLSEALRPTLGRQMDIQTGNQMSAPVIDPFTGQPRGTLVIKIGEKENVKVGEVELEAYRVSSSLGEVETLMWVDDEGKTLKRRLVGELAMERTTRELAIKQAPSLEEEIEMPMLNPEEFASVPVTRHDPNSGSSAPGLGVLEALLK